MGIPFRWSSISGQVPTSAIGQDAFQEVDTVGTPVRAQHNFLVRT
jgi:acetolactate synthase-1/2/3 large subunit